MTALAMSVMVSPFFNRKILISKAFMLSSSMCSTDSSTESSLRLSDSDIPVKLKMSISDKNLSIGKRLVEAFGTDDKRYIAEKLGFSTVGGLYKVLNGERELDFEKLLKFRNHTKRTIDWLLTGEGPLVLKSREFDLEYAIDNNEDWTQIIDKWYEFDGQENPMPDTMGASFMSGWQSFDRQQRMDAVKDFKAFLDRIRDKD